MRRLDQALVEWGYAPSRSKAQAMIAVGEIEVRRQGEWQVVTDNSADVSRFSAEDVRVKPDGETLKFVSRGGLKLNAALDEAGLDVAGRRCLDVGISTGGFTDCLIKRGAKAVLGVDVGHGQLSARLREEPRLTSIEGLHVKDMVGNADVQDWIRAGVDFCVVDVSFISLTQVWPYLADLLVATTPVLALVKPQFEVGPRVVSPELFNDVQGRVLQAADKCGFSSEKYFASAVKGQDGNQEFFVLCRRR